MKSGTLPIYKTWLATASDDDKSFVDSVYEMCERNYANGGDTVVECYEPQAILARFKTLNDARKLCGLIAEQATNCREGNDNDPELATLARFDNEWK